MYDFHQIPIIVFVFNNNNQTHTLVYSHVKQVPICSVVIKSRIGQFKMSEHFLVFPSEQVGKRFICFEGFVISMILEPPFSSLWQLS